jgi:hypothetical protein
VSRVPATDRVPQYWWARVGGQPHVVLLHSIRHIACQETVYVSLGDQHSSVDSRLIQCSACRSIMAQRAERASRRAAYSSTELLRVAGAWRAMREETT